MTSILSAVSAFFLKLRLQLAAVRRHTKVRNKKGVMWFYDLKCVPKTLDRREYDVHIKCYPACGGPVQKRRLTWSRAVFLDHERKMYEAGYC